jgi:histidyl-tRNA synthetase
MEAPKGTRDVFGDRAERKKRLILALHDALFSYGFEYFESPSFERFEVLTAKFAGGEEIISEIFRFSDRGERDLALRFDHTVPLGRFVASHPELALPFKRYAIGSSFRDGPIKTGRLREFTQADADIVGAHGVEAEIELFRLAADVFSDLRIPIDLRVNHRVILETIVRANAPEANVESIILSLDKLDKLGEAAVSSELLAKGVADPRELLSILSDPSFATKLDELAAQHPAEALDQAIASLKRILSLEIPGVRIDPTLARGLNYYTGLVFEAFDASGSFTSALAAGGRYADLIGQWGAPIQATGISFGVDAILESGLLGEDRSAVGIHIVPIGVFDEAFSIAHLLRREGVRVSIDLNARGPSKNLKYADAKGYSHALIIGSKELESQRYTLKTLVSGEQQEVTIEELVRMFTEQVL